MTTRPAWPDSAQVDLWNGPTGHRWAEAQDRIEVAFGPLTERYLAQLGGVAGLRVLDVGCGAGDLALALAHRLGPTGHMLGIDLSKPLLAVARERAALLPAGSAPIELREADAATLAWPPDRDLVASRFGVMFFDDPVAAFRNLRRCLRPGGRLAVLCWRGLSENSWANVPAQAIMAVVGRPEPLPPDAPGAFAFAEPDRVTRILREAGFIDTEAVPIEAKVVLAEADRGASALDEAALYATTLTPGARLLLAADDDLRARALASVKEALRPYEQPDGVGLDAGCWIYEARNPG